MIEVKSGGKRRFKSKKDNCRHCDKEFFHYNFDNQQYCSKQCGYNRVKIKDVCATCGKETWKSRSSHTRNKRRDGNNYCNRECYNNRRKENLKQLKRNTAYYDSMLRNSFCECGVSELYLLQIHHIDGDDYNNELNNLEVVCANCHIKRHLKKRIKDGELVYHTKSLTDRDLLKTLNDGTIR